MAIKRNGEYFTYFVHYENGEIFPRRLHELTVKDSGDSCVLTGEWLPDAIFTCSGNGHKGKHSAHIYLGKKSSKFFTQGDRKDGSWPNIRDLLQISIGFFLFAILNLLVVHFSY